ncbi:MAG: GerAB/ArcD/ProY family transporter [Oscillospiraceae bacterium]|nr:GerAB/ArcD/ProY family transporter [Oscillospiraceae bacterium]
MNQAVKTKTISAQQLFALLIVTRLSVIFTETFAEARMDTALLANAVLSSLGLLMLLLPVIILRHFAPEENVLQVLHRIYGIAFAALAGIGMIVYFVFMTALYDARFGYFARTAINPTISVRWLTVILLLACVYLACRGSEALARAAVILAPILLLAFGLIVFLSRQFSHADMLARGTLTPFNIGVLRNLSANAAVAAIGLFLPQVKGSLGKAMIVYAAVAAAITVIVAYMLVTVFGSFAQTLLFPFYTMASLRNDLTFFHPNVVMAVVWLLGHLVQIAVMLVAVMLIVRYFAPNWRKSIIVGGTAAVAAAASWGLNLHDSLYRYEAALRWAGWAFLVVGVGVPLVAMFGTVVKRKDVGA